MIDIINSLSRFKSLKKLAKKNKRYIEPTLYECEIETIIKALEKQMPKKPYHISEIDVNDNAMVECPICHAKNDYSINTIKSGYCWKCGQKLDWSVEE